MVKKTVSTVTYSLRRRVNSGLVKKVVLLATLLGALATINTFLGDPVGSYILKSISPRLSVLEEGSKTNATSLLFFRKELDAVSDRQSHLEMVNEKILDTLNTQNAILQRLDERTIQIEKRIK